MAVIRSENFDGVTPPALPSGWTGDADFTSQATLAQSSPNGVTNSAASGLQQLGIAPDTDSVDGVVRVSASVRIPSGSTGNVSVRVYGRLSGTGRADFSGYGASLGLGSTLTGVRIYKASSGSAVNQGGGGTSGASAGVWYKLIVEIEDDSPDVIVTAKLQRLSDGYWLNSSGSFQSTETFAKTITDSSSPITGAGKAGIMIYATYASGYYAYADDFLFETLADVDSTPPSLSSGSISETGATTADLGFTTDEANGTAYAVLTSSATAPDADQVEAGTDHADAAAAWDDSQSISTSGAKTFNATGLTAATTYYGYIVHEDAAGNQSDVLELGSVTTESDPLDAGSIGLVSAGPPGINCESLTAASGGDGAITYQWRRSDDGGSYADVSGKTSADMGLDGTATTIGVAYRYVRRATDSASPTPAEEDTDPIGPFYAQGVSGGGIPGGGGGIIDGGPIQ